MSYFYTPRFSHWSKLDSDGNLTWGPDALLTPTGEGTFRPVLGPPGAHALVQERAKERVGAERCCYVSWE